jgi:hypothetical protein
VVRADQRRRPAGDDVREALVLVELREAFAEVRIPTVEGQVSVLNAVHRPPHHREVHARVVEVLRRGCFCAQRPEVEDDGRGDQQERKARRELRGCGRFVGGPLLRLLLRTLGRETLCAREVLAV